MTETPIFEALCADFAVRGIKYEYLSTPAVIRRKGVHISKAINGMTPVLSIVDECALTVPMPRITEEFENSMFSVPSELEKMIAQRYGDDMIEDVDPALIQFADRDEYQIHEAPDRLVRSFVFGNINYESVARDEDPDIQE